MKGSFVYVLEFMLTFDKMQNASPNVHKARNLRASHFEKVSFKNVTDDIKSMKQ